MIHDKLGYVTPSKYFDLDFLDIQHSRELHQVIYRFGGPSCKCSVEFHDHRFLIVLAKFWLLGNMIVIFIYIVIREPLGP